MYLTNFAPIDILENFDSISMSESVLKKGENFFHTNFAPMDILENWQH